MKKYGWRLNWVTYCGSCTPESVMTYPGDKVLTSADADSVCDKCGKTLAQSRQDAKTARINALIQAALKDERTRIVKEMREKMELYSHRADRIESSIQGWFSTLSDIIENEPVEEKKE